MGRRSLRRFTAFIKDQFSHVRIQYRTPQQLGLLERFHATLKTEEVYWRLYDHPQHARACLAEFRGRYNERRPHWALVPRKAGRARADRSLSRTRRKIQIPRLAGLGPRRRRVGKVDGGRRVRRTSCRDFVASCQQRGSHCRPWTPASLFSRSLKRGLNRDRSLSQNQPLRFHLNCQPRQTNWPVGRRFRSFYSNRTFSRHYTLGSREIFSNYWLSLIFPVDFSAS